MGKALDAEERLHVCFTINASIISVKHFTCDLFHFRYLFKMRSNSLKCVIIFAFRKQVLCHYFNELSFFVVYKAKIVFISIATFFPMFIASWKGMSSIPMQLVEVSSTLRMTLLQRLTLLILPSIAPSMFAGFRLALLYSWMASF